MTNTLIKTAAVRSRAKEFGAIQRNEKLRTNDEFLNNFNELVDAVLWYCVQYQDDKFVKTLKSSEWSHRQINKVKDIQRKFDMTRTEVTNV